MSEDGVKRAPNMHDVAAIAGVSHQTVSRVLNGYRSIRPETRDRVLAAISELGYRRNLAARALATSRTHAIGVLTPAVIQHGPTSSVFAVEAAARELGYNPLVTSAAGDRESTLAALGFLLDQSIEGLIVIAPYEGVVSAIRELHTELPVVTLQSSRTPGSDSVGVDQALGTRIATEHLIALGHRRLQHITGPRGYFEASARQRGFAAAISDAGLDQLPTIEGDWTAESGFAAADLLDPSVTAVVAANDQTALGVVSRLEQSGRRVPDDVSVVGFDDLPEAAYFSPPLTTVHQDFDRVGRQALDVLVARLNGETPESSAIDPWLVIRGSTAPPR